MAARRSTVRRSAGAILAVALLFGSSGCKWKRLRWLEREAAPPAPAAVASTATSGSSCPPAVAPERPGTAAEAEPAASPGEPEPPRGYSSAKILGVVPTEAGSAVLLTDNAGDYVVPIFVGGTEALTIQLRLKGEKHARPLTHDLLSTIVKELGGKPVRVQVDEVKGTTFVGSVYVQQGSRTIKLDARPSDAIAFALGNRVPIFASRALLQNAGIPREEIEREDGDHVGRHKRGDPISL